MCFDVPSIIKWNIMFVICYTHGSLSTTAIWRASLLYIFPDITYEQKFTNNLKWCDLFCGDMMMCGEPLNESTFKIILFIMIRCHVSVHFIFLQITTSTKLLSKNLNIFWSNVWNRRIRTRRATIEWNLTLINRSCW